MWQADSRGCGRNQGREGPVGHGKVLDFVWGAVGSCSVEIWSDLRLWYVHVAAECRMASRWVRTEAGVQVAGSLGSRWEDAARNGV